MAELKVSVAQLEEGVTLQTGEEHHITEQEASGKLVFFLLDEGGEPHKEQAFEITAPGDFQLSGQTDAEGRFEHSEPVPYGDYTLQTGNTKRTLSAILEDKEPPRLTLAPEELQDPEELDNSPPEDDEQDPQVPLVEIVDHETGAPPRAFTKGLVTEVRAALVPSGLAGTYEWQASPASKVELTPEGERCAVKGLELSKGAAGEDLVSLTCKFTPEGADYEEEEGLLEVPVQRPGVIHVALVHPMGYRLAGVELAWERDGKPVRDPLLPERLEDDPTIFVEAVRWGRYRVKPSFAEGGRRELAQTSIPLLAAKDDDDPHLQRVGYAQDGGVARARPEPAGPQEGPLALVDREGRDLPPVLLLGQELEVEVGAASVRGRAWSWKAGEGIELAPATEPSPGRRLLRVTGLPKRGGEAQLVASCDGQELTHTYTLSGAGLFLDFDRDGKVDELEWSARPREWTWGPQGRGAILPCNNDDSDGDHQPDAANATREKKDEKDDYAQVEVHCAEDPLPPGCSLWLSCSRPDAINLFQRGERQAVHGPEQTEPIEVTPGKKPIRFELEARRYAGTRDGEGKLAAPEVLSLRLEVRRGGAQGELLATDSFPLRIAPFLLTHHLQPAARLFAAEILMPDGNQALVAAVKEACKRTGADFEPWTITEAQFNSSAIDQWLQDVMEFGYSSWPGVRRKQRFRATVIRTPADRAKAKKTTLSEFPQSLLDKVVGWSQVAAPLGEGSGSSLGNLECSPPVTVGGVHYPYGRAIYGTGGTNHISPDLVRFLECQRLQAPIALDVSFLDVGHVDEVMTFLPDPSAPQKFRLGLASPRLALSILEDLIETAPGTRVLYDPARPERDLAGPLTEASILRPMREGKLGGPDGALASDSRLLGWIRLRQSEAQAQIDKLADILLRELGLSSNDVVELPVLFRNGGSFITGDMVNMLVATKQDGHAHVCVPKPFGPLVPGEAACRYEQHAERVLTGLGLTVAFADVWDHYHVQGGQVHCGTNCLRHPPEEVAWWEAPEPAV